MRERKLEVQVAYLASASDTFPPYRGRENQISTVEERITRCMQRSLTGKPLPLAARHTVTVLNDDKA